MYGQTALLAAALTKSCFDRGGGVLHPWLGIGVPLRVSNPDPV